MGYFSNGSEGRDYETKYCERCINYKDRHCAILAIHFEYNYDQHKNTELGKAIHGILETLIPRSGIANDECSMFHANDVETNEEYLENLVFGESK